MRIKENALKEVTLKQGLEEWVRVKLVIKMRKGYIISTKSM